MNLDQLYVKFNFPASSTFLKLLKNEGLKYTKDEVDKFIKGRTEQQQTTIKTEKKKDLGKIVSFYPLSLVQMDIYDLAKYYRDNQGYKYIVTKINTQEITIKIDGNEITIQKDEFQKLFRVGYCFTCHSVQGMSIDKPYTIHEWERMHNKLKYVAVSRAVRKEHINII